MEAKPACASFSLTRSTLQEIKQELKELGEQQEMTKATLEQLVTKTADQLQEQVRSGGERSHHPPAQQCGPGRGPSHFPWLDEAIEPPRCPGLLAASVPSQSQFLLPFLQLDELRAMVEGTGQEQAEAEAQAACPVCSTDTSVQVGQLLQRYEKLQELVDSFMSRQAVGKVVRQLPGRSQVGRCLHGGLGRGLLGPPCLVVLHCNTGEPLPAHQIGFYNSAAWKEMKALMHVSCWH